MASETGGVLWQYLGAFVGYSTVIILLLLGLLYSIKRRPDWFRFLGVNSAPPVDEAHLSIEETLSLDPQKSIHILRCGHERFLISTGPNETQFLTKLEENSTADSEGNDEELNPSKPYKRTAFIDKLEALIPSSLTKRTHIGGAYETNEPSEYDLKG